MRKTSMFQSTVTKLKADLLVGVGIALLATGLASAADMAGGPPVTRRLSGDQYRQIITDIFGSDIKIGGRFEPDMRENGLLAVGASKVSMTPTGLEQYDGMAQIIAQQVVSPDKRDLFIPCKPATESAPDNSCASQFLGEVGRLLYRRPMTEKELQARVSVAENAGKTLTSFYGGVAASLADMLVSPQFLFRKEVVEPDPDHSGQYRLDAYSKASQLSFLMWNSAPDLPLLNAAQAGELNTQKGLVKQVDRLLASPRLQAGTRAFFNDMFGFDEFATLTKDAAIYPNFNTEVAKDAQEQTLRTLVDHLVTRRGDYRDIFTTRKTFMTPVLGSVYNVPIVRRDLANGEPEGWQPYEFPASDPRAGILMQVSFVALHSHPGRSSPTIRGKALREIMLCQKVPDPPGNVNFTVVQDTGNPQYKTARARVTAHRTDAVCAGCHKLIDPMGLALENFDGGGGFRVTENGAPIDTSGELDGVQFTDGAGLGKAMHDSPAVPACLLNRLTAYSLGRVPTKGEAEWVKALDKGFAADGYRFPDLLRRIATSDEFYRVAAPQTGFLDQPGSRLASDVNAAQGGAQ